MTTSIDYTSRDFDSISASLLNRIPLYLPEWTNLSASDFGVVLIELFATLGDMINFYIDRVGNEAFIDTAVLRQSVLRIAAMLDYQVAQQTAAQCDIQFTLTGAASGITIDKGTPVLTSAAADGSAPVRFETDEDLSIALAGGNGTVSATEGTTITDEPVAPSDGTANQMYQIFNPNVIGGSLLVEVADGVAGAFSSWQLVQNFVDAPPGGAAYKVVVDEHNVLTLQFSDGLLAKIPPIGALIRATYRYGVGSAGNVGVGTVNTLGISLPTVFSAINTSAGTGGGDAEPISSIQLAAPFGRQTQNRAVSLADFVNLALSVDGVAKADAKSEVWTSVNLIIAPVGGGVPNSSIKSRVLAFMSDKVLIGTSITMVDPVYSGVDLSVDIDVNESYVQSFVLSNVQQALVDFFAFDNVVMGQTVTPSQIYKVIHGVAGVDSANITLLVFTDAMSHSGVNTISCAPGQLPTFGVYTPTGSGGM